MVQSKKMDWKSGKQIEITTRPVSSTKVRKWVENGRLRILRLQDSVIIYDMTRYARHSTSMVRTQGSH